MSHDINNTDEVRDRYYKTGNFAQWQTAVYPEKYNDVPTTSESEAMRMVIDPPNRISNHQGRPEMATLENIRTHTRQLTQQIDDHILRCERRNQSNSFEGAAGSNAEVANRNPGEDEASDIEVAERARLVELALMIHDMLNSLQRHPTSGVEGASSNAENETHEGPRHLQARRSLRLIAQEANRVLDGMEDPLGGMADRADDKTQERSRRRRRL